jgi:hypothetical protein
MKTLSQISVALFLVAALVFNSACSKSELQRVGDRASAIASFISTENIPAQLQAEKLISADEAEALNIKITEYKDSIVDFNTRWQTALKQGGNLSAQLAPVFADSLLRLNAIGAIPLRNAAAQVRLQQILGMVHLGSTVIAAFFATQMARARTFYREDDRALAARFKIKYERLQVAALEDYASHNSE